MTSACGSDNYVCILGDFNAQTADLEDFTKNDTFLSEHFHFDQQTDDFFDQNCALEKNSKLEQSSKGTNYKLFKDSINLEPYVLRLPGNSYTYFAKFRTRNHRFPCERGRWLNIELSERKCTLCNLHEVGDEFHYALVCPSFDKERKKFIDPQYFHRPNILKFKSLMNIENIPKLIKLSAFIKILVQTVS